MCPSLVEIRSVTSEIRHQKKKNHSSKYKALGVAMPCGLKAGVCVSFDKVMSRL